MAVDWTICGQILFSYFVCPVVLLERFNEFLRLLVALG